MRKILGGCLIVLVIAIVGFGVAGFYAYRAARPVFDDYLGRARELSTLSDQVNNQSPYAPPTSGELTSSQVERFIAVQGRVRSELGDRWTEFEKNVPFALSVAPPASGGEMNYTLTHLRAIEAEAI
ncbi:MAG: hypothetical protein Q8L75_20820, partial [Acidobacteriota bacterium]|nr:hypothetical protein [Acidobacteriota bacterium]